MHSDGSAKRGIESTEQSGAGIAFPSQTLYVTPDTAPSAEKRDAAEARVRDWRANGNLQLPRFRPEKVASLKDSLPWPPEGSAMRKTHASEADSAQQVEGSSGSRTSGWRLWFTGRASDTGTAA